MKEWDPRFIGLLRNVLSCKRKDNVPTQRIETVIDDIMTDVNVLRMEDERVEACSIGERKHRNRELCTGAKGEPRDHENTTVH